MKIIKKISRFLTGALMMLVLTGVMGMRTEAAAEVMPGGGLFDASFYAASYPDVPAALGNDPNVLYRHYLLYGAREGKLPYDGYQSPGYTAQGMKRLSDTTVMSNGRVIDLTKPMVALTYDDGPSTANGTKIMDLLEQYNGRATFFLIGKNVAANAAEVQRMVNDGMEVANHSFDHTIFTALRTPEEIQNEVVLCNQVIYAVSGFCPRISRLPGGERNDMVMASDPMPKIYWTIDTRDWETKNAQATAAAALSGIKDGDIVLMHEIWSSTVQAQSVIIPTLAAQGYQMVTVSELAALKGYTTLRTDVQYSGFHIPAGN